MVIGSRDADRARSVSATLPALVTGGTHAEACRQDATIIGIEVRGPFALPVAAGGAAQETELLLPGSTVVAAFHHLSAGKLRSEETLNST